MPNFEFLRPYLERLESYSLWGIGAERIALAFAALLVLAAVFHLFKNHILKNLQKLARKTATDLDDIFVEVLGEIPDYFYWVVSAFIAFYFLGIENELAQKTVRAVFITLVVFRIIAISQTFVNYALKKIWMKDEKQAEEKQTATHGIRVLASIILWSAGILLVLSNLGIEISALIASLGIGGIAVAFALQNVLGDLFSSFAIYFDKPFEIGDLIVLGTDSGNVKKIGLKTTRITTLQGEELVISNAELTSTRIKNFKRMQKRRVLFAFGVTYATTTAKLKKIPEIVKRIIAAEPLAEIDRVHFKEFGNFSLNFEVVYYVKSREFLDYMDTQQKINLALKAAFEKEKIEMAFPTQTIYLEK